MKNIALVLLIGSFGWSCQKMPKACIELSPSNDVTVFDEVRLNSCSEDAYWYSWEIEDELNGTAISQQYGSESVDFIWKDDGTFNITLRVQSEKMKKEDETSTFITVNDVCYTCSNGTNSTDICYSDYDDKATFDASRII